MSLSESEHQLLEQLYRAYYHQLFLYARAILRHDQLAEEAVQDTFHIACLKIAQLRASPNSVGWLVQTLKNVLRNMERTRSSLYSSLQRDLPYEERYVGSRRDEENISLLYGNTLTEEELSLLQRIAVEGCTYLEASRELGISVEACRKRMQRIRDKLRKNLTH